MRLVFVERTLASADWKSAPAFPPKFLITAAAMRHQERFVMSRIEDRGSDIMAMGRNMEKILPGATRMAQEAVANGWTVELFRSEMLEKLPSAKPISPVASVPAKEMSQYSIARAIRALTDGKGLDGVEAEISQEISIRTGLKPSGFWMPDQILQRSAVAGTGTLGGMIVSRPVLGAEFIELLKSPVAAINLGAKVMQLASPVTIPKKTGAATVNWANGETTSATLSAVEFGDITLSPKVCTGFVQFSRQLALTSNPQIEQILQGDLLEGIGLAIDKAVMYGSGSSGEPTGLANTAGINTVTLSANGAALTTTNAWPAMVSLETAIATNNGDVGAMGYVFNAATRGKLKTITKTGLDTQFVWDGGERPVNTYNAAISNQLLTNETCGTATTICTSAWMGAWDSCVIAEWGGGVSDVVIDPYTLSTNRVIRILVSKHVDVGFRRANQFARLVGIIN
jgi:HK97 family phage major capsid protein